MINSPLEADTRILIDRNLENLGWKLTGSEKNVYCEQPRTEKEKKALEHKRPDYILYSSKTKQPLIVIEAKRKGCKLDTAMEQGIYYAERLKAPIVFATDGIFCKSYHTASHKAPLLNGEEIDEFIRETLAIEYITKTEFNTISEKVQYDRKELIKIFDYANNILRGEGLSAGLERFSEFSNILFLKLITENERIKKELGEKSDFNFQTCSWEAIRETKIDKIEYINNTVLNKLNSIYNSEEIFTPLTIRNQSTLDEIMDLLSPLKLTDIDSDIKGDAFEYFLKAATESGNDLGQYFTPRHIVKTMVRLTNPQIGEKVYDPFCGTGGFLIESFRHIYNNMYRNAENKEKLKKDTIFGNEITATARIAKMNMILAGDGHSGIQRCDSLANPVEGKYNVVITNMPYSQKIKQNNLYDIPSKNGDCICVQHCMKAINSLAENGRMALVVPEGFLFRKDLAKMREYLLANSELRSIISLPQGVFLPYTNVKTNIIYAEKVNEKIPKQEKRKDYWYFEVKNDGYSLDAHRRKLDTPSDLQKYEEYRNFDSQQQDEMLKVGFDIIPFEKVKENDFNLVGKRYRKQKSILTKFDTYYLDEIIDIKCGKRITQKNDLGTLYPVYGGGGKSFYTDTFTNENEYVISRFAMSEKCVRFVKDKFYLLDSGFTFDIKYDYKDKILKDYIGNVLLNIQNKIYSCGRGQAQINIDFELFKNIEIPIPPLEVQQQIVKELDSFQQIIDGAKQVITTYKPKIDIEKLNIYPITELVNKDLFEIQSGGTPDSNNDNYWNGNINWITLADLPAEEYITSINATERKISEEGLNHSSAKLLPIDTICISSRATIGRIGIANIELATNQGFKNIIIKDKNTIIPKFLAYYLREKTQEMINLASGATFKEISKTNFETITINIPPLEEQKQIVAQIETEQELINSNKKLIEIFTQKIQNRINQIFED